MLKAMSAPYGQVRFMPTGGIDINNLMDYLSLKQIIAVGGSYMVTKNYWILEAMWKSQTFVKDSR